METIFIRNPNEMKKLASKIASIVQPGDIVILSGVLGVGKTFFASAFVKSLVPDDLNILSPTFTLVQKYPTKNFDIYHFDLYRIKSLQELYEIGFEDAFEYGVSIIEWPEMAYGIIGNDYLNIEINYGKKEEEREVKISCFGEKWQNRKHLLDLILNPA